MDSAIKALLAVLAVSSVLLFLVVRHETRKADELERAKLNDYMMYIAKANAKMQKAKEEIEKNGKENERL